MMMAGERGGSSNLREKNVFLSHQEKRQAKTAKRHFVKRKEKKKKRYIVCMIYFHVIVTHKRPRSKLR